MRPGRGVAEWHMLPSWNSLHTLLVARAVLLWHGASYPMLRCSSLARHPDLGPPTVPCARRPLFWYPIPVRIGSPTGDAWLTCQCASQSACSAFHNIRRLSLPSRVGEGTSHCAICWLRLDVNKQPRRADRAGVRTARENARLEIGPQRGRNSHQIGVLGIYDLQGLSYGRTELLVAGMRLLAPDPSGTPRVGRCQ